MNKSIKNAKDSLKFIKLKFWYYEWCKTKKRKRKYAFKRFKAKLKKMHLAVSEELILPKPDEIKKLMNKMDELLKLIDSK